MGFSPPPKGPPPFPPLKAPPPPGKKNGKGETKTKSIKRTGPPPPPKNFRPPPRVKNLALKKVPFGFFPPGKTPTSPQKALVPDSREIAPPGENLSPSQPRAPKAPQSR